MATPIKPDPKDAGGLLSQMFEAFFRALIRGILRLFGIGRSTVREAITPVDSQYRAQLDRWAADKLAVWLHETRPEIDTAQAHHALLTSATDHPDVTQMIRETLIDVKVTFAQQGSGNRIDLEAFTAPRQSNRSAQGTPNLLRWHAERPVVWAEIPDAVRERLIRSGAAVTLNYAIPGVED